MVTADGSTTFDRDAPRPSFLGWQFPQGMWSLSLVNFALKFVTLGIYQFWARTEVRRRLWASIKLMGEPLTYTGTGRELFLGFLIVFGLVILPAAFLYGILTVVAGSNLGARAIVIMLLYFFGFLGIGAAIYRAQKYRFSRTTWRGIKGSLGGSTFGYAWT
ncbi:MAG: DUF898 family protein, partial [Pseudomonadota bacterium]